MAYTISRANSGGQRQRVAVARVLADEPAFILAHDHHRQPRHPGRRRIMALLADSTEAGHTVIVVTHDRRVAHGRGEF